jgi:anti-sigma B factor antagonist
MQLTISERTIGDITVLDLTGNINLGDGEKSLRETIRRLLSEGKKKILVNMAEVKYVDSAGNGAMVSIYQTVRSQGGSMRLLNVDARYRKFLHVTKLLTIFPNFNDENVALASFAFPLLSCLCPVCGGLSGPAQFGEGYWMPQTCTNWKCRSRFIVVSSPSSQNEALVENLRIQTYEEEYFEIFAGRPVTVQVVGRLDLFSSSALQKTWHAIPTPRRVIFELHRTTEMDNAGREALVALLAGKEKGSKAVISLEGLGREQVDAFPGGSAVFVHKAAAVKALGDVSDTPRWSVQLFKS